MADLRINRTVEGSVLLHWGEPKAVASRRQVRLHSQSLFSSRNNAGMVRCVGNFFEIKTLSTIQFTPATGRVTIPSSTSQPSLINAWPYPDFTIHWMS